ncbi:MAG: FG-GAP-like repeat-containing protein [Blastocatellia bacterium]
MKPSDKSSRLNSFGRHVIASVILCVSIAPLKSGASPAHGEPSNACGQGAKLKAASPTPGGRLPNAIATGDFNRDGLPDLVVAGLTPNSSTQLSILLGNGRGEFANVGNLISQIFGGSSSGATNVFAVSDLNGDGKQDIAFASGDGVALLISKGDGTFAAPVNVAPTSQANAVVAADFNGDGKRDLVASGRNGVVTILRGNGDGTFASATTFNAGNFAATMGSADLNGDGKPDLVIFAGSLSSSYLNNGSDGFTKGQVFEANSSSIAFALGDFNSDGKQDLIYSDFSSARLRLGDGMGGFGPTSNLNAFGSSYVAADLNKDNRSDLIALGSNVSVLFNGATGFGTRTDYAAGRFTVSAAVADFNQDGLLDVAALNQGGSRFSFSATPGGVFFLSGEAEGRLRAPTSIALRETLNSIKTADLNNDGRADLIATAGSSGATSVVLSSQNGFASPQTYGFTFGGRDYRSAAVGDFNNDGKLDLATLGYNSFSSSAGALTVFPGTSPGVFNRDRGVDYAIGDNPDSLVAADFNRDGFIDLASANIGSNDVSILFNKGRNSFGMEMRVSAGLEPRSIVSADFDNDGNPDLAVANRNGATLSLFLGDGRGNFNQRLIGIAANPRSVTVTDINGDAKPDIVIPNNNTGMVSVLLNIGGGNFSLPVNSDTGRIPFDTAVGDFTGDGKADLAISGFSTRDIPNELVSVFAGDGGGKFTPADEYQFPTAGLLAAGDFNADGLSDLAVVDGSNTWIVMNVCNTSAAKPLTNVSSASFRRLLISPEMIVTAFGSDFTAQSVSAASLPLPTQLGGVTVKVKDNLGVERLAPLFFAGAGQINYQMPAGVGGGSALITVTSADNKTSSETVLLAPTSPSLFAANADGQGVATAAILRIKYPGGEQSFEPVAQFDSGQGKFIPLPIDFGSGFDPAADQLFLVLFGTGIRFRNSLADVTATVGTQNATVLYAGSQGNLVGLDQINLRLSRNLRGAGEVNVTVIVDGKSANVLKVAFK